MSELAHSVVARFLTSRRVFEKLKTGKPAVFEGYRWERNPREAKKLLDAFKKKKLHGELFFTDDPATWGTGSKSLITMKIQVRSPLVLLAQKGWFESSMDKILRTAKSKGHDAVVYVPARDPTSRQGLLLRPNTQVKSMKVGPHPRRACNSSYRPTSGDGQDRHHR